jgi:hypothetical protein
VKKPFGATLLVPVLAALKGRWQESPDTVRISSTRALPLLAISALFLVASAQPGFASTGDVYRRGTVYSASTHPNHGSPTAQFGPAIDLNVGSGSDDYGMPVYAPGAGRVSVFSRSSGGFGNAIIWTSADGTERIFLGHLSAILRTGAVCSGEPMGRIGSTGQSSGPHLHVNRSVKGRPVAVVLSGKPVVPGRSYKSSGPLPLRITRVSVSPSAISPNRDGRSDTVRVRFALSETARLGLTVSLGHSVVKRVGARAMRGGVGSITWDGTDGRGRFVGPGLYRVVLSGMTRRFRATLAVWVRVSFTPLITVTDSRGRAATKLPVGDTLMVGVRGLRSEIPYRLSVISPAHAVVGEARLVTGRRGEITLTALAPDIGFESTGAFAAIVADDLSRELGRKTVSVEGTRSSIHSADAAGKPVSSFPATPGAVWVLGRDLSPGQALTLYVVPDRAVWVPGTPLADVGGGARHVTAGADGRFLVKVWSAPMTPGRFDLVGDLDSNAVYDEGDLVDDHLPAGFVIDPTP